MKNQRPYAFISYSHKDTAEILPLIEGIKSRGFHVWYDAGIEAGTEWPEYIGTKLFECSCVLAFITQNAVDSPNCRREIDFAVELDKKLLAIYLQKKESINLSPGLRMQINNKQAMLMQNSASQEEFLNNLSMAEILNPCRITAEWDELYPAEEEQISASQASSASQLKMPHTEPSRESTDSESQRNLRGELSVLFNVARQLEEEGCVDKAFENYLEAARQGHPEAMYRVAECYRLGKGTPIQEEEAYRWYQKAAQKGVTMAMLRQAKCYEQENGTRKGQEKAFLLYSIAAKLNNVEAMYELGLCYVNGLGTEVDKPAGIAWLEKAAEKDCVEAMYTLGTHYRYDEEHKDLKKAHLWLDCAAYWRHADSMYELGLYFYDQNNYDESCRWFTLAAQKGHLKAIDRMFDGRWKNKVSELELFQWYRKAAEHGNAEAMCFVGRCYAEGNGVQKDLREAAKWYHQAAEAGEYRGMWLWAECCANGTGTTRNGKEAFSWYQKASSSGLSLVYLKLADCYLRGIGTRIDEKKSFVYCYRAYNQDPWCEKVLFQLSKYYAEGIGTEKDPEKAFTYCKQAYESSLHYLNEENRGIIAEINMKLAGYYDRGFGTDPDPEKALQHYVEAAECGDEYGMLVAADCYAAGIGTKQKPVEAFAWYQRAAEHLPEAKYKLAFCYMQGFGTRKNGSKAFELLFTNTLPDAQLWLAKQFEQDGNYGLAAEHYCNAACEGSDEAYKVITRASWYRIRCFFNPCWWFRHRDAVRHFHRREPIALPWEKTAEQTEV